VRTEVWRTGKTLLASEGMNAERAGSFLGRLVREYGQRLVLDAVRDCARVTPAKASEWLTARCQERRRTSGTGAAAIEARNAGAAADWIVEGQ
jgi:hypothetical protein